MPVLKSAAIKIKEKIKVKKGRKKWWITRTAFFSGKEQRKQ